MNEVTQVAALPPTPPACTEHSWCEETGPHQCHLSAAVRVTVTCGTAASRHKHDRDPYIDARILDLGTGPVIGFADCDLTADGLRAEVHKILGAVPQLLAIADTLDRSLTAESVTA